MLFEGRTILITGGTRGIGRSIALKCAAEGANIAIAAKTVVSTPRAQGTIFDAAEAVEKAGGRGLPIELDVRDMGGITRAVQATVDHFGGLDVVINNAGAIQLLPTEQLSPKRFDLMYQINVRAVWGLAHAAIPHLKKARQGHFVTLSPPVSLAPQWFANHTAYTVSKYAMSMLARGLAEEWRGNSVTSFSLWPRTTIATAAVAMLGGELLMKQSRRPEIMADALVELLGRPLEDVRGRAFLDEEVLRAAGVEDFSHYAVDPESTLAVDLFVDHTG